MTRAILFAILGAALCLTHCAPARAGGAERALLALCPTRLDLAPQIEAQARRHMLHPVLVVSLMHVESRCKAEAVSRRGAIGLLQVMPYGPAANGLTRAQLRDPATNIKAGCRWLSMLALWCNGLPAGIGAYNSGSCHKSKGFARHVLARFAATFARAR